MRITVLAAVFALGATLAGAAPDILSVQHKTADLRATPAPFAALAGSLEYGARVIVLESSGPWRKVRRAEGTPTEGWLHVTALTEKTIALQAGTDTAVRASSDEVALAGKGFNSQVESQVKAGNPKLDFAAIDRMEKLRIPQEELKAFLAKGGLTPKGGRP